MKKTLAPAIFVLLISPQVAMTQQVTESMPVPESFDARASYSIGVNMGRSLAAQAAPAFALDRDYLFRGIADALASSSTLLDDSQMESTYQELQKVLAAKQQELQQQAGQKNAQEGKAYLERNGQRPEVMTLESGLQYEVLTEGTGAKPTATDRVSVHYEGALISGQVFDSSVQRGAPATFAVNGVIGGWTEALQLMPVGSKWKLYIPSDLAYGERGSPPRIGPNSVLVFEVELLSIEGSS